MIFRMSQKLTGEIMYRSILWIIQWGKKDNSVSFILIRKEAEWSCQHILRKKKTGVCKYNEFLLQKIAVEQFPESGLEGNLYENPGEFPRCFPCLDSEQRWISLVLLHVPKISSFQNVCLESQSGCVFRVIFKV